MILLIYAVAAPILEVCCGGGTVQWLCQFVKSSLKAQCTVIFFLILCLHKKMQCSGSFSSKTKIVKTTKKPNQHSCHTHASCQLEWLSTFCVNCAHCLTGQCVTINISSVSNDILAQGHERLRWEAAPVNKLAGIFTPKCYFHPQREDGKRQSNQPLNVLLHLTGEQCTSTLIQSS